MATAEQWLAKLTKIRVDRASGDQVPHKPVLLLTVFELAEQDQLPRDSTKASAFDSKMKWPGRLVQTGPVTVRGVAPSNHEAPGRARGRLRPRSHPESSQ